MLIQSPSLSIIERIQLYIFILNHINPFPTYINLPAMGPENEHTQYIQPAFRLTEYDWGMGLCLIKFDDYSEIPILFNFYL